MGHPGQIKIAWLEIGYFEDLVLFLKLNIGCPPTWGALSGALNFLPFYSSWKVLKFQLNSCLPPALKADNFEYSWTFQSSF